MLGQGRRVARRTSRRTVRRQMVIQGGTQPEPEPQYAAPPPAVAAPAAQGADYTAELEKLAQLKTQGILTDEEFEAKKKQILGI